MSKSLKYPFCGDDDVKIKLVGTKGTSEAYAVMCDGCGARSGRRESKELAVNAWDERAEILIDGLTVDEVRPYIELAEKMNLCDLVRENKRLSDKIMYLECRLN